MNIFLQVKLSLVATTGSLDLADSHLESLPEEIFDLPNLEVVV